MRHTFYVCLDPEKWREDEVVIMAHGQEPAKWDYYKFDLPGITN